MNNTATVTGVETDITSHARPNGNGVSNGVVHRPNTAAAQSNGKADETTIQLRKSFIKKYRHVAAVHSQTRPSTLSHDAPATPSFLGFRNLMVIVLGEYGSVFARCYSEDTITDHVAQSLAICVLSLKIYKSTAS